SSPAMRNPADSSPGSDTHGRRCNSAIQADFAAGTSAAVAGVVTPPPPEEAMPTEPLQTIDPDELSRVSGGTSSNDQITAALTQITNSLNQLSTNKNQTDPMQLMLMMMMMGGMGGGGGGGVVAAPARVAGPGPPVINVDTSVAGGGRPWGMLGGGGYCQPSGCGS